MSMIRDAYRQNKSFLETVNAISENDVYAQPAFNYNGTNVEMAVLNAYCAGKIAYPERFGDIDIKSKADEIFEVLLDAPFYEEIEKAGMGFGAVDIKG